MLDCLLSKDNQLGMQNMLNLPKTKASIVSILNAIEVTFFSNITRVFETHFELFFTRAEGC